MSQKQSVEVTIAHQKLNLRTDEDPTHVQLAAELVNKRLNEALTRGQPMSHQVLLLTAMSIASDLVKAKDAARKFKDQVRERSEAILTRLEKEFPL